MDLSRAAVEQYLYDHIPLSRVMAVSVMSLSEQGVILSAPLDPNINHRSTAFGGSISAVAILSAWTLVHVQLQRLSMPCRIVIQSNSVEYLKPIKADFHAHCIAPPVQDWQRFVATLSKRGKGRIKLNADVYSQGLLAGKFQGAYAGLKQEGSSGLEGRDEPL